MSRDRAAGWWWWSAAGAAPTAMAGRRGRLKRKPNFTVQEVDILTSQVLKHEQLLFGAAAGSVNADEKQKIWWRITDRINAAGRNRRDIGEVKNRWRSLRRPANDQIAWHHLQRQAQPSLQGPQGPGGGGGGAGLLSQLPELGSAWCLRDVCPSDALPPGPVEAAAFPGMKKEPVKGKLEAGVKPEPFWPLPTEAQKRRVARGAVRRRWWRLRSSGQPSQPCEGWSRNLLNASQTELSLDEPGGQQEALGSDYSSLTFDQGLSHSRLKDCNLGDMVTPVALPIQEGLLEESLHLSLAERRVAQSNEQLVQEVHAFRQECAESHRETASILHNMAEALSGICSSLTEIRDLYLHQQVAPKP